MPPRPIVNDALWRCLCPSYAASVPLVRANVLGSGLVMRNQPLNCPATKRAPRNHARGFKSTPDTTPNPFAFPTRIDKPPAPSKGWTSNWDREKPSLVHFPTAELYERLRIDAAAGKHEEVMNILKILIKDRREIPNVAMYAAIIHSYVDPEEGTAGKVRKVLEEMQAEGIDLDAAGCQCVLEALSVHPDYLLRNEILEYMKERWFTLSDRGHNYVVAGMLRDRLFEQALEMIEDMLKQRIRVERWIWDTTMWILLEFGEVEEAFHVLVLRQSLRGQNVKLSNALWLQLLDSTAQIHLTEAVNMIWNTQVVPGYIKPATGTCLHVLTQASRQGDIKLATDVFRVLTERETVFDSHHYEMLIEAYLNVNDLQAALSVAVIVQESYFKVDEATFHPLFLYLKTNEDRPMEAFTILQNFEATKRRVPTAAVNACIQASVFLDRFEEAIEMYKALHTVSKAGPNTTTFNILFQGCRKVRRKELAMFLANEMLQLNLKPDSLSYDRLILLCCSSDDLQDAFLYYEEMRDQGFEPRKNTWESLMMKAWAAGDARAVVVLKHMKEREIVPRRDYEKSVRDRFEQKAVE
ncbi:hypothetical protein BDV95DRAFT_607907 [Massariosphaeria phaeospora]|uniref:Pentatricopeptide repeat-containing protein-mitochondrial domain-containing protein n=1 Tax=Massariosphaeria phaeospora TaxID=100035 RepID=A0A7C8I4P8_9PLEO|nr:hypothetical protein BDV95DRAFT_607907 [Massariosphaeria phaeospora]